MTTNKMVNSVVMDLCNDRGQKLERNKAGQRSVVKEAKSHQGL